MKEKSLSRMLIGIVLVLAVISPTPTSAWEPPKQLVVGTAESTSSGYIHATGMNSVITQKTGVVFKIIGDAKAGGRAAILKEGVAYIMWVPAGDVAAGLAGILEWQKQGPQSIRLLWNGGELNQGLMVRGNSGIKKMPDLRGKRVPVYPGVPAMQAYYMTPALAYANLSWDDVKAIPTESFASAINAVIEGSIDAAPASTTMPATFELKASIYGIGWLPMPAADKEAWARYHKINPGFFPAVATYGGGISADKPIELWAYNYQVVAYDSVEANLAYWYTKQIHVNYDAYKDKHAALPKWTIDHSLDAATWFVPWHEGSIKYFKEIKRWTPEMEARQQQLLAKYPQTMTQKK